MNSSIKTIPKRIIYFDSIFSLNFAQKINRTEIISKAINKFSITFRFLIHYKDNNKFSYIQLKRILFLINIIR